jgi:hypothetical protein
MVRFLSGSVYNNFGLTVSTYSSQTTRPRTDVYQRRQHPAEEGSCHSDGPRNHTDTDPTLALISMDTEQLGRQKSRNDRIPLPLRPGAIARIPSHPRRQRSTLNACRNHSGFSLLLTWWGSSSDPRSPLTSRTSSSRHGSYGFRLVTPIGLANLNFGPMKVPFHGPHA